MARPKTKKRAVRPKSGVRKRRHLFEYPLFVFLLLCTGVFLAAWTFRAAATDIIVTARIPGPPVTSPAVIDNPVNGDRFSAIPIPVNGTCPVNAAYVEIFRNGVMSGSAICEADSTYQLSIDLFPGQNDLTAHVFNITDDEGPVSDVVTVYYDAPQPPPPPTSSGNKPPSSGSGYNNPLILKTAFVYKGYYVGQPVEWPLQITGGSKPYVLHVDWGDKNIDVISRANDGEFKITHTYTKAAGAKGDYTVKVNASDSSGQTAYIQFFVIVNANQNSNIAGNIFSKPPPALSNSNKWLWLAWPAYVFVLIMAISYWLGEREEIIILRRQGLLKR